MASGLVFPKHVVLEFMIVLLTLLATLQLTFALMRAAFLATSASRQRALTDVTTHVDLVAADSRTRGRFPPAPPLTHLPPLIGWDFY